MTIYVKECPTFSLENIKIWIKKEVKVTVFKSIAEVKSRDLIVISQNDKLIEDLSDYNIIIYEKFLEKILSNIILEYEYNHDYYYLKNALSYAMKSNITTLISGSSYGAFGIDMSLIKNAVNLSSISQDLYYSQALLKLVCENNVNIKNIVLCVGYYCFFPDLSKTKNLNELSRISKVYKPLLNDVHNCVLLPPSSKQLYESNIIDIKFILDRYTCDEYLKGFFHKDRPRKNFASKIWDDKSKSWKELSNDEKINAGEKRAELHNRNIKRESSLKENIVLFQNFVNFCTNKKINLLVVVTPSTSYYRNCLENKFKLQFYDILFKVKGTVHLLDLSDDESFVDDDFNDTDHLNDIGAQKLTSIVVETLKEMENL